MQQLEGGLVVDLGEERALLHDGVEDVAGAKVEHLVKRLGGVQRRLAASCYKKEENSSWRLSIRTFNSSSEI